MAAAQMYPYAVTSGGPRARLECENGNLLYLTVIFYN